MVRADMPSIYDVAAIKQVLGDYDDRQHQLAVRALVQPRNRAQNPVWVVEDRPPSLPEYDVSLHGGGITTRYRNAGRFYVFDPHEALNRRQKGEQRLLDNYEIPAGQMTRTRYGKQLKGSEGALGGSISILANGTDITVLDTDQGARDRNDRTYVVTRKAVVSQLAEQAQGGKRHRAAVQISSLLRRAAHILR